MLRVAFVCTGNRARSPLAAARLVDRTEGLPVAVSSCGLLDVEGMPALPSAVEGGAVLGLDLRAHRSQPLRPGCLADDDLVIGFEAQHAAAAVQVGEAAPERVFLLLELPELLDALPRSELGGVEYARHAIGELSRIRAAAGRRDVLEVPDPIGAPQQVFAETMRVIDIVTRALAASLFPRPPDERRSATALRPGG